jgi:hypothetical protein
MSVIVWLVSSVAEDSVEELSSVALLSSVAPLSSVALLSSVAPLSSVALLSSVAPLSSVALLSVEPLSCVEISIDSEVASLLSQLSVVIPVPSCTVSLLPPSTVIPVLSVVTSAELSVVSEVVVSPVPDLVVGLSTVVEASCKNNQ